MAKWAKHIARASMAHPARGMARVVMICALALALVAVGLPPAPAVAGAVTFRQQSFSDTRGSQAPYFDVAGAVGIVHGDRGLGGPARPSQPVSRAEFAVMVTRLLRLDPAFSAPEPSPTSFGDAAEIPEWAVDAVTTCFELDIIRGVPNSTGGVDFRPHETVTGAEAVVMLLRALGNDKNIRGGWPSGYIYRAFETGLSSSSDVGQGDWRFIEPFTPLTRAQTVYLVHNALFCWRDFTPGEPGQEGVFSRSSIGGGLGGYSLVIDANPAAGFLTAVGDKMLRMAPTVVAPGVEDKDDLIGRRIFWLRDNLGRVVYIRPYAEEPPVTGVLRELNVRPDGTGVGAVILESGRVIGCAAGAVVELNGQRWPFDPSVILPTAQVTAILDQGEAVYVSIMQEDLPEAVIMSLDFDSPSYQGRPTTGSITARISMGEGDIPLKVGPETDIFLNGSPVDLSELRERDIFYAATEGSLPKRALRIYAYRNRVTGRVLSVIRRYTAGGFHWQVSVEDQSGHQAEETVLSFGSFCEDQVDSGLIGREYTFCLNRYGKVAYLTEPGPLPDRPVTVKVLGEADTKEGRLVTVEWKGAELTYRLPAGLPAPVPGSLVRLHLATMVRVERIEPVQPAYFEAEVASVDVENERLTLTRGTLTWTLRVRRVPIYAVDDANQPDVVNGYVPLRALSPGRSVWLTDPGAPQYILVEGP